MHYSHLISFLELTFLLFTSGIGYSVILFPRSLLTAFLVSPIISYSLITILSANLNFLGFSTGDFSVKLIITIIVLSLCLFAFKFRRNIFEITLPFRKITVYIILTFAFFNSLIILSPALLHNSFNYINDHTTYIIISEYLQEKSFLEKADIKNFPWTDNVLLYQTNNLRMGTLFFIATIKSFMGTKHTLEIYPAIVTLAEFIFILSFSTLSLNIIKSRQFILFSLLLITFSTTFNHQILLLGFLPQMFGISLVLLLLLLIINQLDSKKITIEQFFLNSLFFTALISSYQEIVPIFFIYTGVVFINAAIRDKKIFPHLIKISLSYAASIFISTNSVFMFFGGIVNQTKGVVGWYQDASLTDYFLKLFGLNQLIASNKILLITTLFTLLLIVSHVQLPKKIVYKDEIIKIISFCIFCIIIIFRYGTIDPFTNTIGNTWSLFKIVQWFYWLPLLWFSKHIFTYWQKSLFSRIIVVLFFIILSYCFKYNFKYLRYEFSTNQVNSYLGSQLPAQSEYTRVYNIVDNRQYSPANLFIGNIHQNIAQLPLSILKNSSTGIFLAPNSSQSFNKDPDVFLPKNNFSNWLYFKEAQISDKAPIDLLAGYNIYQPDTSIIHFTEGFNQQDKVIIFNGNVKQTSFRFINNSNDYKQIKMDVLSNCHTYLKYRLKNSKVTQCTLNTKATKIIDFGVFPPGFNIVNIEFDNNPSCLKSNVIISNVQIL